jgi:membrane protease YdiL (CAAX protease family)
MTWSGRAAALLEVFGVYLAGQLVVAQIVRLLQLQPVNPLPSFTADISDGQLLLASRQLFVLLLLQYAGWFLLIVPIDWWRGARGLAVYGLTRSGRSWSTLLLAGAVTTALVTPAVLGLQLIDGAFNLGETVPWRQAIFDTSWRRWEFWLFAGVLSFGFVAVVEEVFYRGYCQRRLAEAWGHGPAIAAVACFFTFAHGQYLFANPYNVGMLLALVIFAVGAGVVFAWTGSLIPSIFTHAIMNTPMTPGWQVVALACVLMAAAMAARPAAFVVRQVWSRAGVMSSCALAALGAASAIVSQRIDGVVFVALALLALALVLTAFEPPAHRLPSTT